MAQIRCVAGFANATTKEPDVCPLPATIRVKLVEDQESEVLGGLDDLLLVWPSKQELQHHVVRQEYVGRRGENLLALLVLFLACVTTERHASRARPADRKELLKLAH